MDWSKFPIWLTVVFTGVTAIFTGLLWRLGKHHLSPRYELIFLHKENDVYLFNLEIENKSYRTIEIDQIIGMGGIKIDVTGKLAEYDVGGGIALLKKPIQSHIPMRIVIPPSKPYSLGLGITPPSEARTWETAKISLQILTSFIVTRHKTKLVTAKLPAAITKAQV